MCIHPSISLCHGTEQAFQIVSVHVPQMVKFLHVKSENLLLTLINEFCHSREGGNPEKFSQRKSRKSWIPASAGMTKK